MLHYRTTTVWQKTAALLVEVYRLSRLFPEDERFGLTPQIRRAAVSIASNFAEGYGRKADKDFAHFLTIARGSAYEVDAQLATAKLVGIAKDTQVAEELVARVVYELNLILRAKRGDND